MTEASTLITGQTDPAPDMQQSATDPSGTAPAEGGQQQQAVDAAASTTGAPATAADPVVDQPIEYTDFTLPEGYDLGNLGDEFKNIAKEYKLTQEQAQKLVDLDVKRSQAYQESIKQAAVAWQEASKADKEFGGDSLDENMGLAKKALDTFGTPELKTLLDQSGLGNHPEIIRAFYRAGKAISEDRLVTGATAGGTPADARRIYSASKMNP